MKLIREIDKDIQIALKRAGIRFPLDDNGSIAITEYRLDVKARSGLLYVKQFSEVPNGKIPFLVVDAKYVYGVFNLNGEALIIEVGFGAFDDY